MLNTGIKTKKPGTWLGAGSAGSTIRKGWNISGDRTKGKKCVGKWT